MTYKGFLRLKVTGYLKTFNNIMSVSLKFHCNTDETTIELVANTNTQNIYIEVIFNYEMLNLELTKSTAIKFSKELRKQIALLD